MSEKLINTVWTPTGGILLLTDIDIEEKTLSGLIVPSDAQTTRHGLIQKIGSAVPHTKFSPGDEVVFAPEQALEVYLDDCGIRGHVISHDLILLVHKKTQSKTSVI